MRSVKRERLDVSPSLLCKRAMNQQAMLVFYIRFREELLRLSLFFVIFSLVEKVARVLKTNHRGTLSKTKANESFFRHSCVYTTICLNPTLGTRGFFSRAVPGNTFSAEDRTHERRRLKDLTETVSNPDLTSSYFLI